MSRPLRDALGKFVTGITVITAHYEGRDYGVTVNSFNSVSLDPPLVLWSLAKTSSSLDAFRKAERFAVHVLAADQRTISDRFASSGTDKFEGFEFERARQRHSADRWLFGAVPLSPGIQLRRRRS